MKATFLKAILYVSMATVLALGVGCAKKATVTDDQAAQAQRAEDTANQALRTAEEAREANDRMFKKSMQK